MQVLFIRHGETAANRTGSYQRAAEPLSARGRAAMQETANQLTEWHPTHILTSPMQRAQMSAKILADTLGLTPIHFAEAREVRWPISLEGTSHRSLASARHMFRWFTQRNVHSDDPKRGESYATLRKRIERTKHILETYPDDARIVVVSHSVYINFFVEHVCNLEHVSVAAAGPRLVKILLLKNTNATLLECETYSAEHTCNWHLQSFNIPISQLT